MPALAVVAVNVCAIVAPLPAEAPVMLVWVTVQLKVVPLTPLVSAIVGVVSEQMLCDEGVAVADGIGLTVTVTTIGAPEHPAAVGVIV